MRFLSFVSIILASSFSYAGSKMELACVSEFPTTSFIMTDMGASVTLEVFHHNGVKYAPIFDGVITSNDLPLISSQGKASNSLGTYQTFEWKKEQCQKTGDLLIYCTGATTEQMIEGQKVNAWSFYTSAQVDTSALGVFKHNRVSLSLQVNGENVTVPMRYYDGECVDNLNGLAAKKLLKK